MHVTGSFNFREAILDLYLFYKEVIQRGGFYEVFLLNFRFLDKGISSFSVKLKGFCQMGEKQPF